MDLKELYELYFFESDIAKKLNLDELYCESMIEASLLLRNSDNKYDEEKYIEKLDIFNKEFIMSIIMKSLKILFCIISDDFLLSEGEDKLDEINGRK